VDDCSGSSHRRACPGIVIYRLVSAIQGTLEHANIPLWRPLDRALSFVWATPNMHKVHHSDESKMTDTNYGNIFAIYDRLFRTFTPSVRAFNLRYGLGPSDPGRVRSLPRLLTMPFEKDSR